MGLSDWLAYAASCGEADTRLVPGTAVGAFTRSRNFGNVTFALGDWLEALGQERFDVIVANPPYIASGDAHLEAGDLRREPHGALVAGTDGLDAIGRIVATAWAHLDAAGWLLLEHGWDQAARVRALLDAHGYLDIASVRDGAGHERVTLARAQD